MWLLFITYHKYTWAASAARKGAVMEYRFIIPGRLDNLNDYISAERSNRYKGAKMKSTNQNHAFQEACIQLGDIHIKKPVKMVYRWYEKDRRRDLDNISSFGRKVIQDALVEAGILPDDGWKYIIGFTDEFYVDKKYPRIEVTIIEL